MDKETPIPADPQAPPESPLLLLSASVGSLASIGVRNAANIIAIEIALGYALRLLGADPAALVAEIDQSIAGGESEFRSEIRMAALGIVARIAAPPKDAGPSTDYGN